MPPHAVQRNCAPRCLTKTSRRSFWRSLATALGHWQLRGYGTWAVTAAWFALGNVVGGVGLVTMLRLVQVGEDRIRDEQGAGGS